jgi:hypothetical protein
VEDLVVDIQQVQEEQVVLDKTIQALQQQVYQLQFKVIQLQLEQGELL